MRAVDDALSYAEAHQASFLEDLRTFLRIPSISTLPEHREDVRRAAAWAADQLKDIGFEGAALTETEGHPIVYGERLDRGSLASTVLVYGHYDVQPVDPLSEWESDPFGAEIRGENIYARGVSDMKAQIASHLKATQAMISTSGLPVNLKYLFEGEEEIGSPHLEGYLRTHRDKLGCDFCLNVDTSIISADTPSLHYALRGIDYFELHVRGPSHDTHSGLFGGVVDNPANVLADLISGMRSENGRITIPGFYDDVRELSDLERRELAKLPHGEDWWKEAAGVRVLGGEVGYSPTERATARPTLDVNGLVGGFTGKGSKTVIPAEAMAKLSMRLVPDQTPEKVHSQLRAYLEAHAPPTVQWELIELHSAKPALIELDSPAVKAAGRALEAVWGTLPLYTREGGTIPVVGMLQDILNVKSVLLGFGLPDDNLHAPNEKFYLPNFKRGIEAYVRFAHELTL